jgi:YD repeat-containing protein
VTEYAYDVGGRLVTVCANKSGTTCGQSRTFTYDNRGLLTSETHPENGTTTYDGYDARGHLRRRYLSTGSFDLRFAYDRSERLTDVDEGLTSTTSRPLKRFVFGTANSGGDWKNGQLATAVRWNWLPNGYTVQVAENYAYTDPDGRPSSRTTADYICGPGVDCTAMMPADKKTHEFQQSVAYDELGATTTVDYPTCLTVSTGVAGRTINNTYSNGFLTGVNWTGNANSISYHASGMVNAVAHSNGVTDTGCRFRAPSRPGGSGRTSGGGMRASRHDQPQSSSVTSGTQVTLQAQPPATRAYDHLHVVSGRRSEYDDANRHGRFDQCHADDDYIYWVRASNACGSADSQTATITVCAIPNIGTGPTNKSITSGQTVRLSVERHRLLRSPISGKCVSTASTRRSPGDRRPDRRRPRSRPRIASAQRTPAPDTDPRR